MNISSQKQKQERLKQFLRMLSEDPSLLNQDSVEESWSLSELLMYTGYLPKNEPVDMSELVSMLLKKMGLDACSDDMMNYVMNGGTVDDFMNTGRQEAT
ncbi:hypothetical protein [Cohnella luojiensis]|uniref:Uncharacterized protein n=1 Tax=Cohnella luojiensis TaxID=652876 RepID=A0A4Y8M0J0_9BACL|nr:hypothetical protein [Cohnella luojiensis]TFE28186.1 hypothetical protein E2980_08195 [Cohnella luojiensis]